MSLPSIRFLCDRFELIEGTRPVAALSAPSGYALRLTMLHVRFRSTHAARRWQHAACQISLRAEHSYGRSYHFGTIAIFWRERRLSDIWMLRQVATEIASPSLRARRSPQSSTDIF